MFDVGILKSSVLAPGWPAWLALHLGIGVAGTWWARRYALRHQLLDQPGERRAHDTPTPRGGGIAIVIALLLALAWLTLRVPALVASWGLIATGLVLVAGSGWSDDHRPLSPWLRLAVHAAAAAALASAIALAGGGVLMALGGVAVALVLVNVWNFMDGIDGLAASQAALAASGYALLAGGGLAWLAGALAAACVGFLPFNLPKARIFLGDVGSGALGFALAASAALQLPQLGWERASVLLLPLSAFVVDAALTLARRVLRGDRWWLPHAEHAYQCWTRRLGRHGVVAWAYAGWTAAMVVIMLIVSTHAPAASTAVLVIMVLAGCFAWWRLQSIAQGIVQGGKG